MRERSFRFSNKVPRTEFVHPYYYWKTAEYILLQYIIALFHIIYIGYIKLLHLFLR